jgi:hypothetical protein
LLSVRDNPWWVDELKEETKDALENITEEVSTAVMGNIKIIVQMLFYKQYKI